MLQRIKRQAPFWLRILVFFLELSKEEDKKKKTLLLPASLSLTHTPLPTSSPATAANQSQRRGGAASPSSSSSRARNSVLLRATTEAATASDPTVSLAAASPPSFDPASAPYRSRAAKDVRVLVVGPTGYIGKFVVKELLARGFDVVAFSREKSGVGGKADAEATRKEFAGADIRFGNVTDSESLRAVAFDPMTKDGREKDVDVVVSCLASRTG